MSRSRRAVVVLVALAVLATMSFFSVGAADRASAQGTQCSEGWVLSDDLVTCELDLGQNSSPCPDGQELDAIGFCVDAAPDPAPGCPDGQRLDAAGLTCVDVSPTGVGNCPDGQQPNAVGSACEPIPTTEVAACDAGFSLGADGVTCVADAPRCAPDEIVGDDGECMRTFVCPEGSVLTSDLLTCVSDGCPDGELLGVDGKRCVAPDSSCPDGSPRPVGGSCLVVETVESAEGTTEVIVRCDAADSYCHCLLYTSPSPRDS